MRRPSSAQLSQLAASMASVFGVNVPTFDRAFENLYSPFLTYVVDLGNVAGQSASGEIIPIGGDYVYVDPDQPTLNYELGSVTIEPNDKTSADKAAFTANPGTGFNFVFTSLKVRYTNQPGKRLVLKYSTGYSVIPSGALTGVVQVQGADNLTSVSSSYMVGTPFGPFAANFQAAQLWNPGGGKIAYLDEIHTIGLTAADSYVMGTDNAARGADFGAGTSLNGFGGGASQTRMRNIANAAIFGNQAFYEAAPVNTSIVTKFNPPVRLPALTGFNVTARTVNTALIVSFLFREKTA